MRVKLLVAAVVVAALLAGCAQKAGGGKHAAAVPDTSWAARALHDDENHDHRDWTQHVGLSTPNFIELAHDPLGIPAFGNVSAGGYFCGGAGTTAEGRRLSVISSYDTSVAFVVVDTTDPAHPKHLGDYILDHAQTYDVDITPDGRHVVIAADVSPNKQPDPPGGVQEHVGIPVTLHQGFRDGCTGMVTYGPDQTVAAGPSTILVSLADPTNPRFESMVPAPVIGPHSVSTAIIGGTTYVGASITNLVHQASYYQFFQITDTPLGSQLEQLSIVDAGQYGNNVENSGPVPVTLLNGHVDAEITEHPLTHKPVVYLSDWDGGLIILDFSNPRLPVQLGSWKDTGPDSGAVHSTRSIPGVHNGRVFVLAGQEFVRHPVNRPSGWVYVLDVTDPTHPSEVGRWTLPVDTQADWSTQSPPSGISGARGAVELFSTHYFRELNGTVFVAMYHGGVWAFKLDYDHPDTMAEPKSVGVFVPDKPGQDGRKATGGYDYAPFVLDVYPYPDGNLVIYDGLSGVYSVHYDPGKDMPSPEPWPAAGRTL